MAGADPLFAQWLQAEARFVQADDAVLAARWGEIAIEQEAVSPLAIEGDAQAEAARQLAFLGGPLVEDVVSAPGRWRDRLGTVVTLVEASPALDDLGYGAGVDVFVVGVAEDLARGVTELTVLRRA